MSLLARSIATLEGIALLGDPNYQMVAQAYPFVVRKVLRNSTASVGTLLRDIVFDASTGAVKPTRLSALLNAALGFVAERTDGFVDLDAVPEDGASLQVRSFFFFLLFSFIFFFSHFSIFTKTHCSLFFFFSNKNQINKKTSTSPRTSSRSSSRPRPGTCARCSSRSSSTASTSGPETR